jgi:nitroimidazol reductase NimA-like FMN-containing flavoprotein (pyridoxamine 5'-phosphate oxidase superfamily)
MEARMTDTDATLSATPRTTLRRMKEKARTDRAELHAVLAAGLVAHLGVVVDGHPMVVPTIYGFDQDHLFFHGSVASRSLTAGTEACATVTIVDGLVLARSVFEHSLNYRSAMVYGVPRPVVSNGEKLYSLRVISEHVVAGQWDYARQPSPKELAATTVLALSLAEASVKVRSGPPDDGASADAALGLWAGELPLRSRWASPVPDPALSVAVPPVPPHIATKVGQTLSASTVDSRTRTETG